MFSMSIMMIIITILVILLPSLYYFYKKWSEKRLYGGLVPNFININFRRKFTKNIASNVCKRKISSNLKKFSRNFK